MSTSFGNLLRTKREHLGLTLRDAAHKTRIPVSGLLALEGDDYESFGSPAYARSFLHLYSAFLGLEPSPSACLAAAADRSPPRENNSPPLPLNLWGGTPSPPRNKSSSAPLPGPSAASPAAAAALVFLLAFAGAAFWTNHLARQWVKVEQQRPSSSPAAVTFPPQQPPPLHGRQQLPAIVKAIPVPETELELQNLFRERAGNPALVE